MDLKNFYKILEIGQTASLAEIKQAYRDMIGTWHPDRHAQNPRF
ncbi:MAG: DnaJ domain-containing protein [Deltaproteobacteria bacterium]|jgi:DnaJ-class molecular chaperone|nr:DnaJ domain-containing protein [Deltaproteobacteria bacterium]